MADNQVIITFGGGLNARRRVIDVTLDECVAPSENFDLDPVDGSGTLEDSTDAEPLVLATRQNLRPKRFDDSHFSAERKRKGIHLVWTIPRALLLAPNQFEASRWSHDRLLRYPVCGFGIKHF